MTKQATHGAYIHSQDVPATEWNIAHNMNCSPIVHVYILYEGVVQRVIPNAIDVVDANNITITFTSARNGQAVLR